MRNSVLVTTILLFLVAGTAVAADTYVIDKAHSDVGFKIRHLMSKVRGRFADFSGAITIDLQNLDASSVEFTINAASVDTGEKNRDEHLRSADFFDVEKYPEITFKSNTIIKSGDNSYDVTGTFTMHGVSKAITLPVTYLGEMKDPSGNVKAGFEIYTTLDRKDYGIIWTKGDARVGATVGDEVEVEINLESKKQ